MPFTITWMTLYNNKPPIPMTWIPWSRELAYSREHPPETRRNLELGLPSTPVRRGSSLGIRNTRVGARVNTGAAASSELSSSDRLPQPLPFPQTTEIISQMSLHCFSGISQEQFLVKM